ncbi:MAG: hypothetical protein ABH952_05280 [Candidatus Omnitrophota bacterium]
MAENKPFLTIKNIFLLGVVIRLALMPIAAQFGDCYNWYGFCFVFLNSPFEVYNTNNYFFPMTGNIYSYPPLWIYTMGFFMLPVFLLKIKSAAIVLFFIKLPLVLCSSYLAEILFRCTNSKKVLILFYLNPLVIFLDSVWGAFDILPATAVFLAYVFLRESKYSFSAFFLSIGILYKIWPVLILPLIVMSFIKEKKYKALIKYLGLILAVSLVLTSPYLLSPNRNFFFKEIFAHASRNINWQLSLWTPFLWLKEANLFDIIRFNIGNISLPNLLFYAAFLILYALAFKRKFNLTQQFLLPVLTFYIFSSWVTPSHYIWILPILAILSAQNQVLLLLYILLSFLPILSELCSTMTYRFTWGTFFSIPLFKSSWAGGILSIFAMIMITIWSYIYFYIIKTNKDLQFVGQNRVKISLNQKIFVFVSIFFAFIVSNAYWGKISYYNPDNQLIDLFWEPHSNVKVYNELGIYYTHQNRTKKARYLFNQAVQITPEYPVTYVNLAAFYAKSKNWPRAKYFITQAAVRDNSYFKLLDVIASKKPINFITKVPHNYR